MQLPDKEIGYVALLDVLGFVIVRGDVDGERIDHYLQALRTAIGNTEVKSILSQAVSRLRRSGIQVPSGTVGIPRGFITDAGYIFSLPTRRALTS